MLYREWSNILEKISHDRSLSGANVIEKIKKELQSYPAAYKEWEKENFSLDYPFSYKLGQNTFKATLLHYAARKGYMKLVEALLEAKEININATNEAGWTALHCAVKAGHIDIAELLLKNGADIDAKTSRGAWTTLSLIIFLNDEKCKLLNDEKCEEKVKFLLERGASVDEVDKYGKTPLHRAAHKGHIKVVEALLDKGANPIKVLNSYYYDKKHVNEEITQHLKEAKKRLIVKQVTYFGLAVQINKKKLRRL